jgi:hypothetical protein
VIFDGVESAWTRMEGDSEIQTIKESEPGRFQEAFHALHDIAEDVRLHRDRASEAREPLGGWANELFPNNVIPPTGMERLQHVERFQRFVHHQGTGGITDKGQSFGLRNDRSALRDPRNRRYAVIIIEHSCRLPPVQPK